MHFTFHSHYLGPGQWRYVTVSDGTTLSAAHLHLPFHASARAFAGASVAPGVLEAKPTAMQV